MPFTCGYTQNWERVKRITRMERKRNVRWKCLWLGLAVFCLLMLAFCLAAHSGAGLTAAYAVLLLFCLYRAFLRGPLRTRLQWRRSCAIAGADHYQVVFTLGENIRVDEAEGHAVELPWTRLKAVRAVGDCLRLDGREKRDRICFYLPRAGFEDGTGEAFLAWLGREHSELVRN